jgi:hypothetical protein
LKGNELDWVFFRNWGGAFGQVKEFFGSDPAATLGGQV